LENREQGSDHFIQRDKKSYFKDIAIVIIIFFC